MILSLSEISTIGATFEENVEAYAAAGFDAIGLREFKLPEDDAANIELLLQHGLGVAVCVPAVPSILQLSIPGMEGPADPRDRIAALCASVTRLAAYDPQVRRVSRGATRRALGRARLRDRHRRPCSGRGRRAQRGFGSGSSRSIRASGNRPGS